MHSAEEGWRRGRVHCALLSAMHVHLVAALERDCLVLRFAGGAWHSELPMVEEDPLEVLARDGKPATDARRLWSLDELDDALGRHGYARTGPWRAGPRADVTRVDG